jgi:eukaryotic-like serine/threonine-protein kinase
MISHYKILEKLGEGGMGVVYKAHDTKLNRTVALKFLPSHIAPSDNERKRFIHEAQSASALDHPNICTIHEIDESPQDQLFIVMSYYEGETLKSRIEQGPLKVEEAIDIANQVAKGLAKAHTHGIVHRDIKPANIIITKDGVAKIVDFGLAKLGGGTLLTKTGTTIGTVAYMSPEQAQGEKVDHRTDIWSLGVVLYEMLTGQRPFRSDYEQALIYLIINGEPEPITKVRKDISAGLCQIISHALAKRVDDRYQSMEEFREDLAAVAEGLKPLKAKTRPAEHEKSIAVLPFINDSPDQENTYFINGVMEEILNNLQRIKDLRVISRTSVEQYRNQRKAISEIAKELGVNYIVEGSAQKYGNAFRLRTQLIKADRETHLWGESFQQKINDVEDIFNIQIKIAESIANELKAVITPEEKQLIEKIPTINLTAYDEYLKGKFYTNNVSSDDIHLNNAMECFERAKDKDPEFPLAYAGIAMVWLIRQQMGLAAPDEAGSKIKEAIERVLELNMPLAEVYYMVANENFLVNWDWKAAEEAYKKALEINPNHSEAHGLYSHLLFIQGRVEEALKYSELSLKLDPNNMWIIMWYSSNLLCLHRYDECISLCREFYEKDQTVYWMLLFGIYYSYHMKEEYDKAFEAFKTNALYFYKDFNHVFDQYEKLGYAGTLNLEADTLLEQSKSKFVLPSDLANMYSFARNKEKTLDCLEKAFEMRDPFVPYIGVYPNFAFLRDEPRYKELLRKLNLPYK